MFGDWHVDKHVFASHEEAERKAAELADEEPIKRPVKVPPLPSTELTDKEAGVSLLDDTGRVAASVMRTRNGSYALWIGKRRSEYAGRGEAERAGHEAVKALNAKRTAATAKRRGPRR